MPNAAKQETIEGLRELVGASNSAILTEYRGLTVKELTNLRNKLRPLHAEYHVVKNTLFKRALEHRLTPELEALLEGPTAVAFVTDDLVAPLKVVLDFLRDARKQEVILKGGLIEGKLYTPDQVTAISKLPSREQLIGQVVGSIQAPLSEFVGTLDNIISDFVRTIQAIADKAGAEGGASAA